MKNGYAVESSNPLCFFLTHHAVIREDAETTKVRIIFIGSFGAGSINAALYCCVESVAEID